MGVFPLLSAIPPATIQIQPQIAGVVPFDYFTGLDVIHAAAVVGIPVINTVHPAAPTTAIKLIEVVDALHITAAGRAAAVFHVDLVLLADIGEDIKYRVALLNLHRGHRQNTAGGGDDACPLALQMHAVIHLVTNPEEVSYLFNLRDFSKPYTSKIRAKAVVKKTGSKYFFDLAEFDRVLLNLNGRIFADKSTLTQFEYDLIKNNEITFEQSPVQKMKSVKTEKEIEHYKKAFERTDLAVSAIRDYIENNENISEFDIAENLEMFYKKFGAKSLSFKSIVAKDKNSALAHYSKCSKDEIIKDGSLILIDCGAYYEGGLATDITRVFVKGQPSALQKKVYTTVLKMFLHSFNYPVCEGTTGYEIDNLARKIADKNQIEGFEFNHGLGHGIGVSVHEYPPNLSKNELAKIKLENNMCFTIEPGLYNKKHFGIRLENSCYMKDGKIHSFVKMNYEKKLIEFDMLTEQERIWLGEFEVK